MDIVKKQWKKNMIVKAWKRCQSLRAGGNNKECVLPTTNSFTNSKSWHCTTNPSGDDLPKTKCRVAPGGCFSVYVGPQKQRFVVKTEFANHPMFKMLLEDAELEYGYNSDGPILLPCEVDLFYKVLAEMENGDDQITSPGCNFTKGYGSLILCSPARRSISGDYKGYGAYRLLSPSKMLKMNQY